MKRGSLEARVVAVEAERRARGLEALGGGSLSTAERAELARLEDELELEGELIRSGTMSSEQAEAWLHRNSIDGDDGSDDRLAELRRRAGSRC